MNELDEVRKMPDALNALADVIDRLRQLGQALQRLMEALKGEAVPLEVIEGEPVEAIPAPDTSGEPASPPPPQEKPVTKEQIRELLVTRELAAVKQLFREFGTQKLSGVPETRYTEFLAKARMLPGKES